MVEAVRALHAPAAEGTIQSYEQYEQALAEAQATKPVDRVATTHIEYGSSLVHEGRPIEALRILGMAESLLDSGAVDLVPAQLQSVLYVNIGLAQGFRSSFENARSAHARALQIAEQAGLEELVFRSHINMGYTYLQMGDTAAAMHAYHTALVNRAADHPIYGLGLVVLADLFIEMGDLEAAERQIDEAILFLTPRWMDVGQHRIQLALARIRGKTGEQEQAERLLQQARAELDMTDTVGHARTWVATADLALFNLDIDRLRESYAQTGAMVPDTWFPPTALVMLVEALVESGDHAEADRYANRLDVDKLPYLSRLRLLEARRKLSIAGGDWQAAYRYLEQTRPGVPLSSGSPIVQKQDGVSYRMSRDLSNVVDLSAKYQELRRDVEMARTAAHDLRTPFQSTMLLIDMLRRQIGPQFNESFDMLTSEIRRADMIVTKMTGVPDEPEAVVEQPQNCETVAREALTRLKPILDAKRQTTALTNTAVDARVSLNRELLDRILDNLLSNASKYSEAGTHVEVTISDGSVGQIDLTISDQGRGFTETDLANVFGFQRTLSAQPTGGESASGLGLYIVKQIVDLVGGSIEISSRSPNPGATVTVSLPSPGDEAPTDG